MSYISSVRWDRFFDDLEDQLASEWEAERVALETEAERLRLSRVVLRDRLSALVGREPASATPSFDLADGATLVGEIGAVGADWLAVEQTSPPGATIVPLAAVRGIGLAAADVLRTARPLTGRAGLSERMTLGFVLRDLVRRRSGVVVGLRGGRMLTGTIDRAGADHLDLALHDARAARRASEVSGYRLIPFDALAWVRIDGGSVL